MLSGEFFLHYKLLYRLPNSGAMHSFRDDLVAMLAFLTVILREWYEQSISEPFLSDKSLNGRHLSHGLRVTYHGFRPIPGLTSYTIR